MEATVPFLKRISNLPKGDKVALKRAVGKHLNDVDSYTLAAFYRCLPSGIPWHQEDRWFAVACMHCLWNTHTEDCKPVEKVIADLIAAGAMTESTQHKIEVLLDTPWDADGLLLTKLARMMKLIHQRSSGADIDFPALLEDLIYWNTNNQSVQKKWARTIFTNH